MCYMFHRITIHATNIAKSPRLQCNHALEYGCVLYRCKWDNFDWVLYITSHKLSILCCWLSCYLVCKYRWMRWMWKSVWTPPKIETSPWSTTITTRKWTECLKSTSPDLNSGSPWREFLKFPVCAREDHNSLPACISGTFYCLILHFPGDK